ncbi:hypothetical protein TNCV_4376681 [Trichonephila clavipes]|nr:hypothetical protein TNCV_4376681 [Trichonephila clavipes]
MTAKAYVPISVFMMLSTEVHEQIFRFGGQSDAKPPAFSSKASLGLGSRPGEGMGVCIVPSWYGGTLTSRRAVSPLVRRMEEEERWEAFDSHRVVYLKIGEDPSKIVLSPAWCSKLELTTGVKI